MNTYIVCPGLVRGPGLGPVSKSSLGFKYFVGVAAGTRQVTYPEGDTLFPTVYPLSNFPRS